MSSLHLGFDGRGEPVHLKSSRLTTHGVVVGMTGSGKTGLSLVLLEELIDAGVPIIAIDPKGDLGNLGLVFPELSPPSFAPWCGKDDPEETAARWKKGIEAAGLELKDVARIRAKMDFVVHTPGSTAGVPVDVMASLSRPPEELMANAEALRDLISDTVSGLFGLVGRAADPVKDPAHVLSARIVETAWREGEDLDLERFILRLMDPPFAKLGVFPVDKFFPPDERTELAVAFNGVLASPSFEVWSQGPDLDAERLLSKAGARTRVSVFALAHLDEGQRQFFVSLLLSKVLSWARAQPGTEELRALLFFDEVAGYLPPHPHNPPSKRPLLTMMKQTRAVGVGVVLSTQNPVDLDYKALSNAGTWAIGRLTTKQDRERLLKGIDAAGLDRTVAALEKRQFVLHQVARGEPAVLGSRHAMCFLRGPLTGAEIGPLNALHGRHDAEAEARPSKSVTVDDGRLPSPPTVEGSAVRHLDPRAARAKLLERMAGPGLRPAGPGAEPVWVPTLFAELALRFDEDRLGFVLDERLLRVWGPLGGVPPDEGRSLVLEDGILLTEAPTEGRWCPLPSWCDAPSEMRKLEKRGVDEVYRSESRGMFSNKALKLHGRAEESRDAFDERCRAEIDNRIAEEMVELKARFTKRADRLDDRLQSKTARLAELEGVAKSRQLEEAVNVGATVLSLFGIGRKKSLSTAVSRRRQSARASQRVNALEAEIERLEEDAQALEQELEEAIEALRRDEEEKLEETVVREVRLEKSDIQVLSFGILWLPTAGS
ncbi:MAG: helicase HerA-like domain-containing protein [Myxococcota bacterium]